MAEHGRSTPVLYTQPSCVESGRVRAWLAEHAIPFTERDVADDPDAAAALAATGVFATPLLVVGEERVLGFRPPEFAALVAGAGDAKPDRPNR